MKDIWGNERPEPNPWFSGSTWRGFILVAVVMLVILPIFAVGLGELTPEKVKNVFDTPSCEENINYCDDSHR